MDANKKHLIVYSIFFLLVIAFFFRALDPGKVFFYMDHGFQNIPFRYHAFQAIREGFMPLWCPYSAAGFPLFAEGQSGAAYVPVWPFYLFLPFAQAYNYSLIIHLVIMGCGFIYLFRKLGYSAVAALSGAVCFTFSGYVIRKLMFVNYIQAFSWMPWLLVCLCTGAGISGTSARVKLVGASVLLGLIALAGHPQALFYAVVLVWLFVAIGPLNCSLSHKIRCTLTVTISGICLGAWQILPTLELAAQSARAAANTRGMFAGQMSLPPAYLPSIFLNDIFGSAAKGTFAISDWHAYEWELSIFVGVIALSLALMSSIRSGRTRFFWICVSAGILLSLGHYNIIHQWIVKIPFINTFRAPARWMFLAVFGFAGLVTHAVNQILSEKYRHWCRVYLLKTAPGILFVTCMLGIVTWRYGLWQRHQNMRAAFVTAGTFLAVSIAIVLAAYFTRFKSILLVLPILLYLELYLAHNAYPAVSESGLIMEQPKGLSYVQDEDKRLLSLYHGSSPLNKENWHQKWADGTQGDYHSLRDVFPMYSGLIHQVELLTFDEWSPLHFSYYTEWARNPGALEQHIIRYFNIGYVLSPRENRRFRGIPVLEHDNWVLDRMPDTTTGMRYDFRIPRFVGKSDPEILAEIARRPLTLKEVFIFEPETAGTVSDWSDNGEAILLNRTNHSRNFRLFAANRTAFVIAEAYDAGWKASLNSAPVKLYRGDTLFQTMLIPPGRHLLTLSYEPESYRLGLFVSLCAVMLITCTLSAKKWGYIFVNGEKRCSRAGVRYFVLWICLGAAIVIVSWISYPDIWNDSLSNWLI